MMQQFRNSQDHFTPGAKPGQSQTQLNMNKRGTVGNNIRQMANAQGSRNANPLQYINNQAPGTFNQLAVGSKGLVNNIVPYDNNSLDRSQNTQGAVNNLRPSSSIGSKKIR